MYMDVEYALMVKGKRGTPTEIGVMRFPTGIATQHDQRFVHGIDIALEPNEFVGRCNRDGKAEDFSTFESFVHAEDLSKITELSRPFVKPLIVDPTKIVGPSFLNRLAG